jgi:hypothetical protein
MAALWPPPRIYRGGQTRCITSRRSEWTARRTASPKGAARGLGNPAVRFRLHVSALSTLKDIGRQQSREGARMVRLEKEQEKSVQPVSIGGPVFGCLNHPSNRRTCSTGSWSMRMDMAVGNESGASMPIRVGRLASLPVVYGRESVDRDPQRGATCLDAWAGAVRFLAGFWSLKHLVYIGGPTGLEGARMIHDAGDSRRRAPIPYSLLASSTILLNRGEEKSMDLRRRTGCRRAD